ncbi:MAG: nucleotide exchange factor GrpE [Actinomycetota bacterium]
MTTRDEKENGDREERPPVRITDKRRVRDDAEATSPDAEATPTNEEAREELDDVARARKQAAEYLEHLQRLKAEFDNYRKRVLREQTRAVELAAEPLVARLLEVVDEFELALTASEQFTQSHRFVQGVEMVYAKLMEILRSAGVERIEALGKPFDPERHEALLQVEGEGHGDPYVVDVLRTGYTLKGRVIRPAGVKVARSGGSGG